MARRHNGAFDASSLYGVNLNDSVLATLGSAANAQALGMRGLGQKQFVGSQGFQAQGPADNVGGIPPAALNQLLAHAQALDQSMAWPTQQQAHNLTLGLTSGLHTGHLTPQGLNSSLAHALNGGDMLSNTYNQFAGGSAGLNSATYAALQSGLGASQMQRQYPRNLQDATLNQARALQSQLLAQQLSQAQQAQQRQLLMNGLGNANGVASNLNVRQQQYQGAFSPNDVNVLQALGMGAARGDPYKRMAKPQVVPNMRQAGRPVNWRNQANAEAERVLLNRLLAQRLASQANINSTPNTVAQMLALLEKQGINSQLLREDKSAMSTVENLLLQLQLNNTKQDVQAMLGQGSNVPQNNNQQHSLAVLLAQLELQNRQGQQQGAPFDYSSRQQFAAVSAAQTQFRQQEAAKRPSVGGLTVDDIAVLQSMQNEHAVGFGATSKPMPASSTGVGKAIGVDGLLGIKTSAADVFPPASLAGSTPMNGLGTAYSVLKSADVQLPSVKPHAAEVEGLAGDAGKLAASEPGNSNVLSNKDKILDQEFLKGLDLHSTLLSMQTFNPAVASDDLGAPKPVESSLCANSLGDEVALALLLEGNSSHGVSMTEQLNSKPVEISNGGLRFVGGQMHPSQHDGDGSKASNLLRTMFPMLAQSPPPVSESARSFSSPKASDESGKGSQLGVDAQGDSRIPDQQQNSPGGKDVAESDIKSDRFNAATFAFFSDINMVNEGEFEALEGDEVDGSQQDACCIADDDAEACAEDGDNHDAAFA